MSDMEQPLTDHINNADTNGHAQPNIILAKDEKTPEPNTPAFQVLAKEKADPSIHLSKLERLKKHKIWKYLDKFFLLLGLAIIIPISSQWPIGHNDGPLHPTITSSWVVTIILFFGIGLGIKIQYLKRACLFWQMNLFTHLVVFAYFPLIGWGIKMIADYVVPDQNVSSALNTLLDGVIILCCLPATAASAVVFTHNAHGNEAAAAINCTLANLLGIFVTPLLILIFMGSTASIDIVDVFMKLSLRVIAPFFVAQIIRCAGGRPGRKKLRQYKPYIRKINEVAIIYIVFCSLSESFYVGIDASTVDVIVIITIVILLHTHSYVTIWYMSCLFDYCKSNKANSTFMAFTVYDRIAIMYSGSSKTIALGIPLIETIFATDENLGMYLIPLLLYKPTCLVMGSILIEPFKKMVSREGTYLQSITSTKTNKIGDDTFISNMTNGTDYGALTAADLNRSRFQSGSQNIISGFSSNSKVGDLPEFGDEDSNSSFSRQQSNYTTMLE